MGCEAELYGRFRRLAQQFRYLDQMMPATLNRELEPLVQQPFFMHWKHCRPVGLLLVLATWAYPWAILLILFVFWPHTNNESRPE